MIILDSNVWIAFLSENDTLHKKAKVVFEQLDGQVIIPEYVILETCSVLLIKVDKFIANHFVKRILDNQDIQILPSNNFFFIEVMQNFINSSNKKLSFIDTALLYLSQKYKIITFDKNLQKAIEAQNKIQIYE